MATTTRKSPRRWALLPGALLALAFCAPAAQAVRTQPVDDMWVVDSPRGVTSLIRSADLLYIGGDFGFVGPDTGGGAVIAPATGAPAEPLLKINGTVRAAVSDGEGGYFIGG